MCHMSFCVQHHDQKAYMVQMVQIQAWGLRVEVQSLCCREGTEDEKSVHRGVMHEESFHYNEHYKSPGEA